VLEAQGWGRRLSLEAVVFEDQWPAGAIPTPAAY